MVNDLVGLKLTRRGDRNRALAAVAFQRIIPPHARVQWDPRIFAKNKFAAVKPNYDRSDTIKKEPSCFRTLQDVELLDRCSPGDLTVKGGGPFELSKWQGYCAPQQRNLGRIPVR